MAIVAVATTTKLRPFGEETRAKWVSVEYAGKLWIFYQGKDPHGILQYKLFTGQGFNAERPVSARITDSPSAVVYDNSFSVFYQGRANSNSLYYTYIHSTTVDGDGKWSDSKKVPGLGLTGSPSAVAVKGDSFHRAANNADTIWAIVFTKGHFSKNDQFLDLLMTNSPEATVLNDKIYCLHRGRDADLLSVQDCRAKMMEVPIVSRPISRERFAHVVTSENRIAASLTCFTP